MTGSGAAGGNQGEAGAGENRSGPAGQRTPAPASPLAPAPARQGRRRWTSRFSAEVPLDPRVLGRLREACSSVVEGDPDAGRDWWPISVWWAGAGEAPAVPEAVARPGSTAEVAAVLAVCHDAGVPVTPAAGRSGVCGGAVPVFGGVSLDLTGLAGIATVDDASLLVDVGAGTWGDELESALRSGHGLTVGHWPQSIAISTVGGWVACRGAGQYSTRYGKIEDLVAGLEVALADGRVVRTGGRAPRSATGPDLTQLFVGAEGTLGVVTEVRLRARPLPAGETRGAWAWEDFGSGLDACRRILRRGATPAVLRLYDRVESARHFAGLDGCGLVVVDEGDPGLVAATAAVVEEECRAGGADRLDPALAERWLRQRNEVPSLADLAGTGIVADTVEVAASWASLAGVHSGALEALRAVEGTIAASAHQSHAYQDGACLYFTFAGRPAGAESGPSSGPAAQEAAEAYYRAAWDAITTAALRRGGTLSHHHGVGLNRGRYLAGALGPAFEVLAALKAALDPAGILNPGKLGLPSPFGPPPWP